MDDPFLIEEHRKSVEELYSCAASYRRTLRIVQTQEDGTRWVGLFHVFLLKGHAMAEQAYSWSYTVEGSGHRRFVAALDTGRAPRAGRRRRARIAF